MRPFVPLLCLSVALVPAFWGCGEQKVSPRTTTQYQQYCSRCHDTGAANAPRRGDVASWEKRLRKGKPAIIQSVIRGPVAMPPRGGCTECTDQDLGLLLDYLATSKP